MSSSAYARRGALLFVLLGTAVLDGGCIRSVPLVRDDVVRLRQGPEIAVRYRTSPRPWVECEILNGDNDMYCEIQDQYTARLRSSAPVDPARATADWFLALVRPVRTGLHFGEAHLAREGDLRGAADALQLAPVLLFRTRQWSLAGSPFSYQPSIVVSATLMDRMGGRVLWRHSCGSARPTPGREASTAELTANHGALYGQMIEAEARRCGEELFSKFRPTRSTRGATLRQATVQ